MAEKLALELDDVTPLDTAKAVVRLAVGVTMDRVAEVIERRVAEISIERDVTEHDLDGMIDEAVRQTLFAFPKDDAFRREIERLISEARSRLWISGDVVERANSRRRRARP